MKTSVNSAIARKVLVVAVTIMYACMHPGFALGDYGGHGYTQFSFINNDGWLLALEEKSSGREMHRISGLDMDGSKNGIPEVSMCKALCVDFIVPGGGSLYYKRYGWGVTFGLMKIAGAYAIFYYYNDWKYWGSLYRSARRSNRSLDPYHPLKFKVPGEGYMTVDEIKREYDKSAQMITFSVIGNILVYAASLYATYFFVDRMNERVIPIIEVKMGMGEPGGEPEYTIGCMFIHRIQPCW